MGLTLGVVACLALAQGVWPQPSPKKYALLVGLDEYLYPWQIPQLSYAVRDVEELAKVLKDQGWEVTALVNKDARRQRIVEELYRHAWLARKRDNDDFLLYYAGHGVRNRYATRRAYWLTYDAHLDSLDVNGIRLNHLLEFVEDVPADRKLILLDHCFSGDLVSSPTPAPSDSTGSPPEASAAPEPPPAGASTAAGSRLATSGGAVLDRGILPVPDLRRQLEVAGEGTVVIASAENAALELEDLEHGVFTWVLVQALTTREADANADRRLAIDELRTYLTAKVEEEALKRAGLTQRVLTQGTVSNSANWFVSEKLPFEDLAEMDRKVDDYKARLSRWHQQGWISEETKFLCWELVLDWQSSLRGGRPLTDREEAILVKLREQLDATSFEHARADELETFVGSLS